MLVKTQRKMILKISVFDTSRIRFKAKVASMCGCDTQRALLWRRLFLLENTEDFRDNRYNAQLTLKDIQKN